MILYALKILVFIIIISFAILQILVAIDTVINSYKGRESFIEKWFIFGPKNEYTTIVALCSLIYFLPAIVVSSFILNIFECRKKISKRPVKQLVFLIVKKAVNIIMAYYSMFYLLLFM